MRARNFRGNTICKNIGNQARGPVVSIGPVNLELRIDQTSVNVGGQRTSYWPADPPGNCSDTTEHTSYGKRPRNIYMLTCLTRIMRGYIIISATGKRFYIHRWGLERNLRDTGSGGRIGIRLGDFSILPPP